MEQHERFCSGLASSASLLKRRQKSGRAPMLNSMQATKSKCTLDSPNQVPNATDCYIESAKAQPIAERTSHNRSSTSETAVAQPCC